MTEKKETPKTLEDETEILENVNNSLDTEQWGSCESSDLLHHLEIVLFKIHTEIKNIQTIYKDLLIEEGNKVVGRVSKNNTFERTITLNAWFEKFKTNFIYQRYQTKDLYNALRYMSAHYDPDTLLLINTSHEDVPYAIKSLLNNYIYKIITGYFTGANIAYAVWNCGTNYNQLTERDNIPRYLYLNNLYDILSTANICVNDRLATHWGKFMGEPYDGNSGYVHSGGNIFTLLAGTLCYLNYAKQNNIHINPHLFYLENIRKKLNSKLEEYKIQENFYESLQQLIKSNNMIFHTNLKTISDLDFLFMSKDESNVSFKSVDEERPKKINGLSAYIIRDILASSKVPNFNCRKLLPFFGLFDSKKWPVGKMYNYSSINVASIGKIDSLGKMKQYAGYRQTSSYIGELPIYLNRLKQGYFPFCNNDNTGIVSGSGLSEKEISTYKGKYGECIDLVIGSTANELFESKRRYFLKGELYTMKCLVHELEEILKKNTNVDDKSSKRLGRLNFLKLLMGDSYHFVYKYILFLCYEQAHYNKSAGLKYLPQFDESINEWVSI